MKKILSILSLLVFAHTSFAQTKTLIQEPTASAPATIDWLYMEGPVNGTRKIDAHYFQPFIGLPSVSGQVLSSTTGGALSFVSFPSTTLTGDVTGTGTGSFAVNVGKLNGVSLAGLSTGILKNTTATGVPSIAVAADFPTLNQSTTGNAATATLASTVTTNANLTGPITSTGNATAVTAGSITNGMRATMASNTIKANNTGSTGNELDITAAQLAAMISGQTMNIVGTASAVNLAGSGAGGILGILPLANGGTGTATPGLVAGTNVSLSGTWPNQTVTAAGSVTSASIVSANGFGGSIATSTTTPAITLTTSVNGLAKGNGTTLSAATAGTDYVAPGGALGTPSSGTGTNLTGIPIATGISGLGSGVAAALATPSSANLAAALTDKTGTGFAVFNTSPTLVAPILGTPISVTLTNATGLPLATGISGFASGAATFLATPTGANLAALLTSTIPVSKGGTNRTGLGAALQVLRTNAGATDTEWATVAGTGDVVAASTNAFSGQNTTALGFEQAWTSQSTGAQNYAVNKNYYIGTFTTSSTATFTGTPATGSRIRVALDNCDGIASFTYPASQREGAATGTSTTLTPSAGSHMFVFEYVNAAWHYTDTLTGPLNLADTTAVTGLLAVSNGGTGTATPGIVAGTNVTVSGTWPNQTVNSTGGGSVPIGTIRLWATADIATAIAAGNLACDGTNGTLTLADVSGGARYIVQGGGTVAAPTFSPVAGSYSSTQTVTIASATSGSTIKYTTDGTTTPTRSAGSTYSTPLSIAATTTLKAMAYKNLYVDSSVTSGVFTIGTSYEFTENFEGSNTDSQSRVGYDNTGWSGFENGASANQPHYATSPIQGTYSFLAGSDFFASINRNFTTSAAIEHLHFRYKPTGTLTATEPVAWMRATGASVVSRLVVGAGGILTISTNTGGSGSSGALTAGTLYYIWYDYNSSSHQADLYVSTSSTKPGSPTASATGGTDPAAVEFVLFSGAVTRGLIDHVVADGTQSIGSNP